MPEVPNDARDQLLELCAVDTSEATLSDWEIGFVEAMYHQWSDHALLSSDQIAKIRKIYADRMERT